MKDKLKTGLSAWFLAVLTAVAGIGCLVTSFFPGEALEDGQILAFCAVFGLIAAICAGRKWLTPALCCVTAVLIGYFWREGTLYRSVGWFLHQLTAWYDKAYGCGIIGWIDMDDVVIKPGMEHIGYLPDVSPALCLIAVPVILTVVNVIVRRMPAAWAILVGLIPLGLCVIVTDRLPSDVFVFLILAAMALLVLTQSVRRRSHKEGNRLTAMLLIPVLLLSHLLVSNNTQISHMEQINALKQRFSWLACLNIGYQGEGPELIHKVNLSTVGIKSNDNTMGIMYVTTEKGGRIYLRNRAYDGYDGTSWSAYETGKKSEQGTWPTGGTSSGMIYAGKVELEVFTGAKGIRYFPYYPADPNWLENMQDGKLLNPGELTTYSYGQMLLPENFTCNVRMPEQLRRRCLELPEKTKNALKVLLRSVLDGVDRNDTRAVAERIAAFVRTSAEYDLATHRMPDGEEDFALWFLQKSDTGYCVHFATAAAVMMRSAGVPARYVTGYLCTTAPGEKTMVTQNMAHAWVEYFDPNVGWRVLEATPAEEGEEPTETTEPTQPETSEPTEPSETTGGTNATDPSENPSTEPSSGEVTQPVTTAPGGNTERPRDITWLYPILEAVLIVTGVFFLLWAQIELRRYLRRRRMYRGTPNAMALERWRELRRYCRLLKTEVPEEATELAEKARFSQHTLSDEELKQLDGALDEARKLFRKRNALLRLWWLLVWAME